MSELKKMTVQALRDLARKALGRGHSRLKTKDELVAALQAAEKKVSGVADRAAAKMKEATGRAAKAAEKMVATAKGKGAAARAPERKERKAAAAAPEAPRKKTAAPKTAAPKTAAPKTAAPVEPDPEGHFVARIAGEGAARDAPHPMTEGSTPSRPLPAAAHKKGLRPEHAYDEQLGELPWSYGDDAFVALPRDPRTLFLYWDHADETLRRVWEGLEGGRPQLWVFAQRADGGWDRVRTVDFALESRSYYIHDLDPGRVYRAEIHVVDRVGRDKLLGTPSNEMGLPPVGASPIIDDRFMRLPWGAPLQQLLRQVREGGEFSEELRAQFARLSDWGRFSASGGGSAGGIGGRPTSGPPSSPSSPFGGPSGRGEGR